MAARMGLGALTFGFLSPTDANKWTQDYYQELSECQPLAYSVNPNVGFLSAFMCDRNAERALMMGLEVRCSSATHFATTTWTGFTGRPRLICGRPCPQERGRLPLFGWNCQKCLPPLSCHQNLLRYGWKRLVKPRGGNVRSVLLETVTLGKIRTHR